MKNTLSKNLSLLCMAFSLFIVAACGGNGQENGMEESQNTTMEASADTASAPEAKLNINTAAGDEFRTIPNVGDQMVHEFEEYRPYVSIQQFRQEIGKYVDEAQVAEYEQYIYVPIRINDSDAATLMQIPGLDESEAEELVSGRPYENTQAFMDALSSMISEDEMTTAESYIEMQ